LLSLPVSNLSPGFYYATIIADKYFQKEFVLSFVKK